MDSFSTILIIAGVLAILMPITGRLVSKAGRPLNPIFFNIHKIISVSAIIMITIAMIQLYKSGASRPLIELGFALLAGILFVVLVATGGMLSFEREWPGWVLKVHQILPLLSLVVSAISIYLLYRSVVS